MSPRDPGRLAAARFALRSHQWAKGEAMDADAADEWIIIDLLTDLRHLCDRHDLCFAGLDRIAYAHYATERRKARAS